MKSICRLSLVAALLLLTTSRLYAGWQLIQTFNDPALCGYFFDANNGLIGTGSPVNVGFTGNNPISIFRTSDGGITWQTALTPTDVNGNQIFGGITDIFMQNALVGYASIWSDFSVLWKTTDGGSTWIDVNPNGPSDAMCVYATKAAIILTDWTTTGGVSRNNGVSFDQSLPGDAGSSSGIDFTDNLHGVVTTRPIGNFFNYYTSDGGLTWNVSNGLPEAWGVYAVKGTSTFLAAPEGNFGTFQQTIYRSQDNGVNWNVAYNFPGSINFTGHISGKGNTVYVQAYTGSQELGLYRSDDLGSTWKSVLGPTNNRDTRFAVTGCAGEVVYAFDNSGEVWKTLDGGDGTLLVTTPNPAPLLGTLLQARAGDTLLIPVLLQQTGNPFSMSAVSFRLHFNEDVLTPVSLVTKKTLSQNATTVTLDTTIHGSPKIQITFPNPLTQASNLSEPIVYLKSFVTLSDSMETSVLLDEFSVNTLTPLPLCSTPSQEFVINRECGDSLISLILRGVSLDSLVSIIPNPSHSNTVQITYHLSGGSAVDLEIMGANGERMATPITGSQQAAGIYTEEVETTGWPSGTYFILLRTERGTSAVRKLTILR